MKISILNRIKELYENENQNIIEYLKSMSDEEKNSIEDILISYDFQAGLYTKHHKKYPCLRESISNEIAQYVNQLDRVQSILEVGVGEATSLALLVERLINKPSILAGVDLSWSRIKYAKRFLEEQNIQNVQLATGDMFELPVTENSVDMVFTFQAIEPNGGRESEALKELYRVARKYLVLVEPCYESATVEGKQRMDHNGYIKNLYGHALNMGYNVKLHKAMDKNLNALNPTSILIIEKDINLSCKSSFNWSCPITKTSLEKVDGACFSSDSLLSYPIIQEIPCLLTSNAIVTTKMLEF